MKTDNIITIHTPEGFIKLIKNDDWSSEINLDEITKIRYDNLFGEASTIDALLNRVGNMKADMEEQVALEKLDLEVFEAKKRSYHSKRLANDTDIKRITEQILEDALLGDEEVIAKRKNMIQVKKNMEYINSLYWSVKGKSEKLSSLLKPLLPNEWWDEIIEGKINGFIIEKYKNKLG